MKNYYIGIMSGTSMDGIDAVLAEISDDGQTAVLCHKDVPFEKNLKNTYFDLQAPSDNELHKEALAANHLAQHYHLACVAILQEAKLQPSDISAIGAHGQTIRHQPQSHDGIGYTKQSLNPALLAELTGIDVIADFRSRDIAAGGQGAPLVPAFHAAQFACHEDLAILNIGGIANLSLIPANREEKMIGFDCGPGNVLMDHWIQQSIGQSFDENGQWAAKGQVIQKLLSSMLDDDYFKKAPPKSTGRDLFNPEWLQHHLTINDCLNQRPEDIQATLLALTAQSIAQDLKLHGPKTKQLLICGGGINNQQLMAHLKNACAWIPQDNIQSTAVKGVDPQTVEAAAFAWLAWAHQRKQPANLPAVTGAKGLRVLGAHYPA
ncbi:anhydro-N-acetylmuramic acid kinase [Polynucleobacter sp. MWH-CaK5]|uniref:anhydro-N-acetylmuramic acid kinase n=1 Tax=Polynucleobacter sp. MWH-CaK5 TaxID=2689107 RepID=UPI001BFE5555|nr:anhydro-N-acetylmuramic acid kinase [Polynucleobacter sp. MWH-CaK5]QWD88739.1 anhydro-N-acetylmuramic acid kinase [Polynucleobacter sp. MWH-CaK5]